MHQLHVDKQAISNIIFISAIAVLVAICLTIGFWGYYTIEDLKKENTSLQQNITNLELSYDQTNSLLEQLFGLQNSSTYNDTYFSAAPSVIIINAEATSSIGEAKVWVENLNNARIFIFGMILEDITTHKVYKLSLVGDAVGNFTYIGSNGEKFEQKAIAVDSGQTIICNGTGSFYYDIFELPIACRITLLTNLGRFDNIGFAQSSHFVVRS